MNEFRCEVVHINQIVKHENADSLYIARIFDYPVIFKEGEISLGDLAVYFPVGSLLPDTMKYARAWGHKQNPKVRNRVLKARKLRGVFSMGLIMRLDELSCCLGNECEELIGEDISDVLGIVEYVPEEHGTSLGNSAGSPGPPWFVKYTSLHNARRYANQILTESEEVVTTEKIHGTNARFCFHENEFHMGTRNTHIETEESSVWSRVANKLNLVEKLRDHEGFMFYGEIYGAGIQKGFDYRLGEPSFVVFDILDLSKGTFLDYDDMVKRAISIGLATPPVLYRGGWYGLDNMRPCGEGQSAISADHVREGFVVRAVKERFDDHIGRVVLKFHGEGYLTRK